MSCEDSEKEMKLHTDKVAAIVVTYNRKELLLQNIAALLNQTRKDVLDILIIDNHSSDGTREILQDYINNGTIAYRDTGSNLGGAGGFHFGIKYAVEQGYRWLWIMDDDTIPTSTALEEFLREDENLNGQYGFLSGKVLWKDDTICTMNIQKETKWKRMKDFETKKKIQYASFVSLFLRSETVRKVGLPYKEFFIWADDWEYTRRISRQDPCYYVPQSIVHHMCGSNVGADIVSAPYDRIDRFNYMYRNDVVLYRQDGFDGVLYLTIRNVIHRIRVILKSDHKKEKLAIIRKGTREGRKFYPSVEFPGRLDGIKESVQT